jgi:hypothetical protein
VVALSGSGPRFCFPQYFLSRHVALAFAIPQLPRITAAA